ncbi:MAG: sugar phosphate isomerase/epimerase [Tannerellaceae bacterium]|jgi:sugar phosphate isomerase/epimerase|nr:sugar phosphate isomerase/epimerase [Tannerellaceae bacterium]
MEKRRDFLKQAGLLAAGGLIAPRWLSSCKGLKEHEGKYMGIQLYSLREMVAKEGIEAAMKLVSKTGFKHVETANYEEGMIYGFEPAEFRKRVHDLGMSCTSAHVGKMLEAGKEDEVMSWWVGAIEAHAEVGAAHLIFPWMPINAGTTGDDLKRYCDYFNEIGLLASQVGIAFGYHNHAFEFGMIEGERVFDFLMDHVNREVVQFELDVYWCQEGGGNPVQFLTERGDQINAIHIKDVQEIGRSEKMDFQPIFAQMKTNGIKNWYVEVEEFTDNDAVKGLKESYEFLEKADYVY